ncbi:DUF2809 domain-containing protein [Rapidithrix thailandica]|uniref:DUF2809 domain-containing protein n=1 Tax=Rapidithrix thailandica TaxID=413964 RepID=A0AAW9S7S0_9BACT
MTGQMIQPKRRRIRYALLTVLTIGAGLFSRTEFIPEIIYPYLGDILYALMIFWIIGFLFPKMNPLRIACLSIGACFLIEISQLIQADWLNQIRNTRLGSLVLGQGFLWSDLVSYTIGGTLGIPLENSMQRNVLFQYKNSHRHFK